MHTGIRYMPTRTSPERRRQRQEDARYWRRMARIYWWGWVGTVAIMWMTGG